MNWTQDSKVILQGITEPLASHYTPVMKAYGTKIVAGVDAGQGGQQVDEIPVFDLVEEAVSEVGKVDVTLIFVEPYTAFDAALEAIAAGIGQIILVTGGIPPLDMVRLQRKAKDTHTLILGPSSAGIIVPEKVLFGTIEPQFYTPGHIGLISRSDNLTDEVAFELTKAGLGQSIAVSLGSEEVVSSSLTQWLQILEQDETTEAIVFVGQHNGSDEETAAEYIATQLKKPVIAYIVGLNAPVDRPLGDAAAIIAAQLSATVPEVSSVKQKIAALQASKVPIATRPSQIPDLVKKALKK